MENDSKKQDRLLSLDALRGMDMAIIIGISATICSMASACKGNSMLQLLGEQMTHAEWKGLTVLDVVFPLFVFVSGIAMSFSLRKQEDLGRCRWKVLLKLWWRALVLVFLGWIVNGWVTLGLDSMRYASVLGLIGVSGALAGTLNVLLKPRWGESLCAAAVILMGVGLTQWLCGDFTPMGCVNSAIDQKFCPGYLVCGYYDPEGILCIVSATAMSLLGCATGSILMKTDMGVAKKLLIMAGLGILMIIVGMQMPIIKRIWTVGFVLCTGGISLLLMSIMHWVVDVMEWKAWCKPFVIIGSNALLIYILYNVFNIPQVANRMTCGFWGMFMSQNNEWLPVAYAGTSFVLSWCICLLLYRHRAFIRI